MRQLRKDETVRKILPPVREHEILSIALSLLPKSDHATMQSAEVEILKWAQKRCGIRLPSEAWAGRSFEAFSGGRNCTGVCVQTGQNKVWSIRQEFPDATVAGRVWITEVVLGQMAGHPLRLGVRTLVSSKEEVLDIEPASPGFLLQLTQEFDFSCGSNSITTQCWTVSSVEDVGRLADMICSRTRRLPVVVLTEGKTAIGPRHLEILAKGILGVASVVFVPLEFSWEFTAKIEKPYSVYGGALRVYMPNFSLSGSPIDHRLVLSAHLSTEANVLDTFKKVRRLVAYESLHTSRFGKDIIPFATIRSRALKARQDREEKEGIADVALLETARERIDALEKELDDAKKDQEYYFEEWDSAKLRAEAAEDQNRNLSYYNSVLEQRLRATYEERGKSPDPIVLPEIWKDFSAWVDANLTGKVCLSPAARREINSAPIYDEPRKAAQCLLWLATECRDSRMNGGEGTVREMPVIDGIKNAHCGNDSFEFSFRNQKYLADWHIKTGGNTRDPKYCLRIYYCWDEADETFIVASMPSHRPTGAT